MKAFLTGSRVYGKPRKDSDIDMVVLLETYGEIELLSKMATSNGSNTKYSISLKFGALNLICTVHQNVYDAWLRGTVNLKAVAPVEKSFAVREFDRQFLTLAGTPAEDDPVHMKLLTALGGLDEVWGNL